MMMLLGPFGVALGVAALPVIKVVCVRGDWSQECGR